MTETDSIELDGPLPDWASHFSTGRLEVGALLPTRDGRRCGNATITRIVGDLYRVVTDAGNGMTLGAEEIGERFWPPTLVKKDGEWPAEKDSLEFLPE